MEQAVIHCSEGLGIWQRASNDQDDEPDVVMAGCGATPTLESLAAASILRHHLPDLKIRVVNVVDQSLRLHLIWHGETEWSVSGEHTGRADVALTTHGEAQARSLQLLLDRIRFDIALTSPALRARHTCELVGPGWRRRPQQNQI